MKKLDRKLRLHRETVLRLDLLEMKKEDLARAMGGIDWTGCMSECTECGQVLDGNG
jgi:hypothetical protein